MCGIKYQNGENSNIKLTNNDSKSQTLGTYDLPCPSFRQWAHTHL